MSALIALFILGVLVGTDIGFACTALYVNHTREAILYIICAIAGCVAFGLIIA